MNVGLGVPAAVAPAVAPAVGIPEEPDGVDTTVGDVGSIVKAPNPVVLACVVRVSKCVNRFMVSAWASCCVYGCVNDSSILWNMTSPCRSTSLSWLSRT